MFSSLLRANTFLVMSRDMVLVFGSVLQNQQTYVSQNNSVSKQFLDVCSTFESCALVAAIMNYYLLDNYSVAGCHRRPSLRYQDFMENVSALCKQEVQKAGGDVQCISAGFFVFTSTSVQSNLLAMKFECSRSLSARRLLAST